MSNAGVRFDFSVERPAHFLPGWCCCLCIHPSGWVRALSDPHPAGITDVGAQGPGGGGSWPVDSAGYSCLKELSVRAFKCHLPLEAGDFPGLGCHFTCLTGAFVRRSRRPHTRPHCIFLVSRLSWKKNKKKPTRLPDFDSPAQPKLAEASGAGLLVTPRGTEAWLVGSCRRPGPGGGGVSSFPELPC